MKLISKDDGGVCYADYMPEGYRKRGGVVTRCGSFKGT